MDGKERQETIGEVLRKIHQKCPLDSTSNAEIALELETMRAQQALYEETITVAKHLNLPETSRRRTFSASFLSNPNLLEAWLKSGQGSPFVGHSSPSTSSTPSTSFLPPATEQPSGDALQQNKIPAEVETKKAKLPFTIENLLSTRFKAMESNTTAEGVKSLEGLKSLEGTLTRKRKPSKSNGTVRVSSLPPKLDTHEERDNGFVNTESIANPQVDAVAPPKRINVTPVIDMPAAENGNQPASPSTTLLLTKNLIQRPTEISLPPSIASPSAQPEITKTSSINMNEHRLASSQANGFHRPAEVKLIRQPSKETSRQVVPTSTPSLTPTKPMTQAPLLVQPPSSPHERQNEQRHHQPQQQQLQNPLQQQPLQQSFTAPNSLPVKTLNPPTEPTFKVPSPVDTEKLRKAQWEQQKRESERIHNKVIFWSRTQTNPPIETFPPKPKRVEPVYKPPEKEIPKEEPPEVKPRPPAVNVLEGYSVDTIFLALTQEPSRGEYSSIMKPLADLVREKQEEIDAASAASAVSQEQVHQEEDLPKDVEVLETKEVSEAVEPTNTVEDISEVVETLDTKEVVLDEVKPENVAENVSEVVESLNTGEDLQYVAKDMKKLEDEIEKDVLEIVTEEPAKPLNVQQPIAQLASPQKTPVKKGRPRGSKKFQAESDSDTDTESLSEEDEEDEEEDEDFDIERAVRAIDDVHRKARQGRKARHSKTVLENGDEHGPSTSKDTRHLKRKPPQDPTTPAPKQRRSERLKNTTAKMEDFFFESAVTVQSEQDASPEPPREKVVKIDKKVPSTPKKTKKQQQSKSSKENSRRNSLTKAPKKAMMFGEEETPKSDVLVPSTPKKTRNGIRMEYSRRVSNETVQTLLGQVLIPTEPENCQILDYFPSPVIRRAIVNKNTLCYAISMVQLLLRVPQIYSIIRSHSHKDMTIERPDCFLCMITNIISERPRIDDYPEFIAILRSSWKNMEAMEMHCVMEAMQHFFNKFDVEYMHDHPDYIGQLPTICSPIRSFFEIDLILDYKCRNCSHKSNAPDKAIYISVDLTKKSDGTMQSMVDSMANPSAVHGMVCPRCKQETLYSTTRFTKLPEVLLYFVPRVKNKKREKDMTVVTVQKQLLLRDEETEHRYALCAFLTHCGINGNKGHYKSFEVDRSGDVHYNEFDDARVVINSKLSSDITVVLAMFRKEDAVAKDAETDMIFDGRGNIMYAHEKHCKQD